MNQTPNCPCRWCKERTSSCHSICNKYAEWKKIADRNSRLEHEIRKSWRGRIR